VDRRAITRIIPTFPKYFSDYHLFSAKVSNLTGIGGVFIDISIKFESYLANDFLAPMANKTAPPSNPPAY
jgi:hypothetical protein